MRNNPIKFDAKADFIRSLLQKSGAAGIIYSNSGGKDSALVGILCKAACENPLGLITPCGSKRNYGQDLEDGLTVAKQYQTEPRTLDLTPLKDAADHCGHRTCSIGPHKWGDCAYDCKTTIEPSARKRRSKLIF